VLGPEPHVTMRFVIAHQFPSVSLLVMSRSSVHFWPLCQNCMTITLTEFSSKMLHDT
jgi:hypothetical protein